MRRFLRGGALLCVALMSMSAHAQEDGDDTSLLPPPPPPPPLLPPAPPPLLEFPGLGADAAISSLRHGDRPDGWYPMARVGLTTSFAHSRAVIGQPDGTTLQAGAVIGTALRLRKSTHQWDSTFDLNQQISRNPTQKKIVKSIDFLRLTSVYVYGFKRLRWMGFFGQASFETPLFRGFDILAAEQEVQRIPRDGDPQPPVLKPANKQIRLTEPFEPMLLKESSGLVATPIDTKIALAKVKLGVGAQHVLVKDGYAIRDQASTPVLELEQLEDSNELGGIFEAAFDGSLAQNLTYGASATFFWPFVSSGTQFDRNPTGIDSVTTVLLAKLSVRIQPWMSLDYLLSARRQPRLIAEWQIQNQVVASFSYTFATEHPLHGAPKGTPEGNNSEGDSEAQEVVEDDPSEDDRI